LLGGLDGSFVLFPFPGMMRGEVACFILAWLVLGAKRDPDMPLYVVEKHTAGMQVERGTGKKGPRWYVEGCRVKRDRKNKSLFSRGRDDR